MSDCPPADETRFHTDLGNSRNHRGWGQNVLRADGSVGFSKGRIVNGDDLYRNQNNCVAPGLTPKDSVLGRSDTRVDLPANCRE
jgi:hypothetical protein